MKKVFVDIESTGLEPKTGQIVELAIIEETGRCLLSTRYGVDLTLGLQSNEEINAALDYNNLSLNHLNSTYNPISIPDLYLIEKILQDNTIVAHNAKFDKEFLSQAFKRVLGRKGNYTPDWVCTMELLANSKGIKSGRAKLPNMQLDTIPHSALSDAQNCRLLYRSLTEKSNDWIW